MRVAIVKPRRITPGSGGLAGVAGVEAALHAAGADTTDEIAGCDVALLLHASSWQVFRARGEDIPHVLMAWDAAWEMRLLRHRWFAPRVDPMRAVVRRVRLNREVAALRREERTAVVEAANTGVVVAFTEAEARALERRTGVAVRAWQLSYPEWPQRRADEGSAFLLLGNLESTHTRFGLSYFFDEIWPHWGAAGLPLVRIVGGGALPRGYTRPADRPGMTWCGFIEDLAGEWQRAYALLVPVPLGQGIRTRIVEAWARGVPVIAHPAACEGLPQLVPDRTGLVPHTPADWVHAARAVQEDPALRERLARAGREAYETNFTAAAGGERLLPLLEEAMRSFRRGTTV